MMVGSIQVQAYWQTVAAGTVMTLVLLTTGSGVANKSWLTCIRVANRPRHNLPSERTVSHSMSGGRWRVVARDLTSVLE
jgi:ABC-type transport system involved in cytochrome c biogenesis permease subunit